MKTLVIHPQDPTTDFLKVIYKDTDYTIINARPSKKILKESIKAHDRIIMLGHGFEKGLFDLNGDCVIDSNLVYLLREKLCVAIWCNADVFFLKYGLKGIYSGMIISEYIESMMYSVICDYADLENSNVAFAREMKILIENNDLDNFKLNYSDIDNNVIEFNKHNVYIKDIE